MLELFDVPWTQLDLDHVQSFLDQADEEGVTWEAKGGDDAGNLRREHIHKAGCGLANQLGGYLILGAYERNGPDGRSWELRGLTISDPEPKTWIGKVLRGGLSPVPRFEVRHWPIGDARHVFIVWIDPIAQPPCMTTGGQVYERVSGETLPVKDPAVLAALVRRGEQERDQAVKSSAHASYVARWELDWTGARSVSVAIGIAPVGQTPDDIDKRLFSNSFRTLARQSLGDHLGSRDEPAQSGGITHSQDSVTAAAHHVRMLESWERTKRQPAGTAEPRLSKLLIARWDGSVVAAAHYASSVIGSTSVIEDLVLPGWCAAVPLLQHLGGYGPAHLTIAIVVATRPTRTPLLAGSDDIVGDPPSADTLFATMPSQVEITRWIDLRKPTDDEIASIHREMQRAAGHISLEPE